MSLAGPRNASHVLRTGQTAEHPDAVDLVEDPLSDDAYEDVITRVAATQIRPLLLSLPERERDILERRANEETLRSVARSLGLSHQRVAALEERAIARVRLAGDTTSAVGRDAAEPEHNARTRRP
jgi:DNA-directed RNA polymerase sigma subunit (sigma70/sigma32)